MKRAIIIVLDGTGIDSAPDAHLYGDEGSKTLPNLAERLGGLNLPNLEKSGLGNITDIMGIKRTDKPLASYGKLLPVSPGKDSVTGHWELAGLEVPFAFPVYPEGFPSEIIDEFTKLCNIKGVLGNCVASGTEIIQRLGDEHVKTGLPIVYTSADSVFQIATHTDIIPLDLLYEYCEKARSIINCARVIARPFEGISPNFQRTQDRKDFAIAPLDDTLLDIAKAYGLTVSGIGKIEDLFANRGLTKSIHTHINSEGINELLNQLENGEDGANYLR